MLQMEFTPPALRPPAGVIISFEMTLPSGRPYAGAADLRRMEAGLARAYRSTSLRVGDLSWLSRESTHRELSLDIRLWDDDAGQLIAWTYFRANGEFNV